MCSQQTTVFPSLQLFSFTNTGEPKYIVKEFIEEVRITLHWITDEALMNTERKKAASEAEAKLSYERSLERKVRSEKDKVWKSLLDWAISLGNPDVPDPPGNPPEKRAPPMRSSSGCELSVESESSDGTHGSSGEIAAGAAAKRSSITEFCEDRMATFRNNIEYINWKFWN